MSNDEVMQRCPICDNPMVRRADKPTARIGGMSAKDQGLPPFWWFCNSCDEFFDGVEITRSTGHDENGSFGIFTVVLDNGSLPPAWTLETAVQAACDAASAGRVVVRIERGAETVLKGADLRAVTTHPLLG
jgi:hypothetical protein